MENIYKPGNFILVKKDRMMYYEKEQKTKIRIWKKVREKQCRCNFSFTENSGSGKSSYLYRNILKEAAEHPEKNYLVLVPEQFTMQTQRELVRLEKSHAIMNVDVLSFARLAYRVFDELGKQNLRVLGGDRKESGAPQACRGAEENLSVLGGNLNRMGYISEVKSSFPS